MEGRESGTKEDTGVRNFVRCCLIRFPLSESQAETVCAAKQSNSVSTRRRWRVEERDEGGYVRSRASFSQQDSDWQRLTSSTQIVVQCCAGESVWQGLLTGSVLTSCTQFAVQCCAGESVGQGLLTGSVLTSSTQFAVQCCAGESVGQGLLTGSVLTSSTQFAVQCCAGESVGQGLLTGSVLTSSSAQFAVQCCAGTVKCLKPRNDLGTNWTFPISFRSIIVFQTQSLESVISPFRD